MAKFRLEDAFNITGRGIALTGRIIEGTIKIGNFIKIGNDLIRINQIEMFSKAFASVESGYNIGILVGNQITKEFANKHLKEELIVLDVIEVRDEKINQILK